MTTRDELRAYLDEWLQVAAVRDYCPNGLQVEGRSDIRRVALGVTASLAFLEQAAAFGADAAIVHHGLFWSGPEELRIERSLKARLAVIFAHDMNLFAYHLPLDRHLEVGNNALLAARLGASSVEPAFEEDGTPFGLIARLPAPVPADAFFRKVADIVGRVPLVIAGGPPTVSTIGILSGRSPRFVEEAARRGLDVFLTGEASEPTVHLAREEKIHLVAAGHHATERFGVQALGERLAARFALETRIIDIDNPV